MAGSELPLSERLQAAWDKHVQMLWMKPCLTPDLLRNFRDLWHQYTASSDDRTSTELRAMDRRELLTAIRDLVWLWQRVSVTAATANGHEQLATLADIS